MCPFAESSFQSLSSRFGGISGCRSKVFLSPACDGVESSAEPIMEIPRFSEVLLKRVSFVAKSLNVLVVTDT